MAGLGRLGIFLPWLVLFFFFFSLPLLVVGILLKITNQKENSCQDQWWTFQGLGYCGLWLEAQLEFSLLWWSLSTFFLKYPFTHGLPVSRRWKREERSGSIMWQDIFIYICILPTLSTPTHTLCLYGATTESDALEQKQILEAKYMVWGKIEQFCRQALSVPSTSDSAAALVWRRWVSIRAFLEKQDGPREGSPTHQIKTQVVKKAWP